MKLNIPKEQEIKILRQRISELDSFNFIPKAWKDRTILDCKEIFGELSNQWIQVYGLNFDTYVTAEKAKVLNEGKQTARNLINSYIDFIQEYSKVIEAKQLIKEKNYEDKYFHLPPLIKIWKYGNCQNSKLGFRLNFIFSSCSNKFKIEVN
jgi:hypothetical protein